jgi:ABC-type transport system involved in multi-copper enzyme maturation permease subunit
MRAIPLVALASFRESVRDRGPLTIVGFGVLLLAGSFLLGQLTAGQDLKIIKDLGLAAIEVLGLVIAVFIGVGLVAKEIERRSIYSLLSKPVTREQFILGKFVGLSMTLASNLGAMCLVLYGILLYQQFVLGSSPAPTGFPPAADPRLMIAALLIFGELMIVIAVALLFSTFAGPLVAVMLTLALWIAGHFNADLRNFEEISDVPAAIYAARGLYYVLPNLAPFDVKAEVVHGLSIPLRHVLLTLAYGAVYVAALMVGAMVIFRRRDLR